jgi:hypothetical protein
MQIADRCQFDTDWWWNRQVGSNQYGLAGRAARKWGPDSHEGNLSAEELKSNRADQTVDTAKNEFRDQEYFKSRDFNLADIEVPVLSVANWVCEADICVIKF